MEFYASILPYISGVLCRAFAHVIHPPCYHQANRRKWNPHQLLINSYASIHRQTPKCKNQGGQKMEKRPKKLLEQVRETIRLKHYSIRTEQAHASWIRRYFLFHNKRHPKDKEVTVTKPCQIRVAENHARSGAGRRRSGQQPW